EGVDDALGSDGIAASRALELRSFGRTVPLEKLEPVCGVPMGVDIDDASGTPRRWCVIVSSGNLGHLLILRCGLRPIRRRSARCAKASDGTHPAHRAQITQSGALRAPIPDSYGSNDQAAL